MSEILSFNLVKAARITGWRWTRDPELNFPPPIKIRNRCFRSRRALEAFKERMLRETLAAQAKKVA